MKISCERDKFSQAFQLVASVAAAKDVKPVLQNVKISITDDGVLLQATDTEIGIRLLVDSCDILEKGEAILPTKQLKKILQESTDKTLQLESSQDKAMISVAAGPRDKFTLPTQPTDEFPDVEQFAETAYHEINVKTLREIIRRTVFAIDEESTRYALGGVLLEFIDGKVNGVATDGRRLAFQEGTATAIGEHQMENTIFPAKALHLVDKALGGDDEIVQVAFSANRAIFRSGKMCFFTRLIEGRFPRWRNIIPPTEGKTQVEILAGALHSAVRKAAIVTSEKQPGVIFTFSDGKLALNVSGSEFGKSDIDLPIAYTGEPKEVKLDPKFVTDVLRVLEPEKNISLFIGNDEPIHLRTDDAYVYVIMPLS